MILPEFILESRVNLECDSSGLDSLESCMDPLHFKKYNKPVKYHYNSRGFRDLEWPLDLSNSIWCFGDSFTVGLGQPFNETWPQLLQQKLNQRTINISMDGASNNWIARKVCDVLNTINPNLIVIHWSFINRRETLIEAIKQKQWEKFYNDVKDPQWPGCSYDLRHTLPIHIQQELDTGHSDSWKTVTDEQRRTHIDLTHTLADNITNTLECLLKVEKSKKSTRIIHSFISDFAFGLAEESGLNQALRDNQIEFIPEFEKIDLARDGFHYDLLTCKQFVKKVISCL